MLVLVGVGRIAALQGFVLRRRALGSWERGPLSACAPLHLSFLVFK